MLAIAGIGLLVRSARPVPGAPGRPRAAVGGPDARDQGLLVTYTAGGSGAFQAELLAGSGTPGSGAALLLPAGLQVGAGSSVAEPLAVAAALDPPGVLAGSVATELGLRVGGVWELTASALRRLVDALGGVWVTVAAPVHLGASVLIATPGRQLLDGRQAVAYADSVPLGGPDTVLVSPRLSTVLAAVLAALPGSPTRAAQLRASLAQTRSEPSGGRLVAVLEQLARSRAGARPADLALTAVSGSGAQPGYVPDAVTLAHLLATSFAADRTGSLAPATGVLVLNGVGSPGLGAAVGRRLAAAGLDFVGAQNAAHFGYRSSQIQIFSDTPAARALGREVARALGLPDTLVLSGQPQSIAAAVVVIGANYRPS